MKGNGKEMQGNGQEKENERKSKGKNWYWVRKKLALFGVSVLFGFGKPLALFRVSLLIVGEQYMFDKMISDYDTFEHTIYFTCHKSRLNTI